MSRYYCPYCSPRYQFHKKRTDGTLICGQCGDPLVKIPIVRPTQIFALIAASAFIFPLVLIVVVFIQDSRRNQPTRYSNLVEIVPTLTTKKFK